MRQDSAESALLAPIKLDAASLSTCASIDDGMPHRERTTERVKPREIGRRISMPSLPSNCALDDVPASVTYGDDLLNTGNPHVVLLGRKIRLHAGD
jgi:hypothetical protein